MLKEKKYIDPALTSDELFVGAVKSGILFVGENGWIFNHKTGRYIGAVGSGKYPKISMMFGWDGQNKKVIKHIQIHRLVWLIHRGPIPEGMIVDHLDEDKFNCAVVNLELATKRENTQRFHKNNPDFVASYMTGNTYHKLRKRAGRLPKQQMTV